MKEIKISSSGMIYTNMGETGEEVGHNIAGRGKRKERFGQHKQDVHVELCQQEMRGHSAE